MHGLVTAVTVGVLSLGQDALNQSSPEDRESVSPETSSIEFVGSVGQLEVPNPWVADAESIQIDGALDESLWDDAPVLTGFTQFDPVEGVPATQRTEARVLITGDAILFAIRAFDDDPGGIRATLGDRDSYERSDDYVRVMMDTFNDRRRAYVIMVNPLGVQQDGLWVEGGGGRRGGGFGPPIDWNPDFVWESAGQLHDWGYSVEVKVPFKSLRFREVPVQDWGLQIERRIQRNGYGESWAPVTENVANKMEQFGRLTGLRDLDPGLFLEVNPVQTLNRQGRYDSDLGTFDHGAVTGDFGMNVTYGLTSNLTLDGTYNPDFSQVEADAGQIQVNERFPVFFQEKRPFFLEGTEIFNLPRQLVYTRSIVNPVGGAKLTGKVGSFNVGYLGAVDDVIDPDDSDAFAKPVVNLVRVRRDLGTSSNLGMVYTDRTLDSNRYNRVGGLDGRFVFNQRNTVTLLAAASRTGEGPADMTDGSMFLAQYQRSGRNFSASASIEDMSPEFDAGSGFIRRVGDTQMRSRVGYNFRGRPGDLIERWGPNIELEGFWNHDDFWAGRGLEEAKMQLGGSVSFRNNITIFGNFNRSYFNFTESAYGGLTTPTAGGDVAFFPSQSLFQGLNSGTLFFWVNTFDRARGNIRFTRSETPLFHFRTGTPVDLADSWSGDMSLNLFPTTNLTAEVGVRHSSLYRKFDGSLYSEATIPRLRAQYQFTRALFLRTIFEYGSETRGDLRDPTTGEVLSYCSGDDCTQVTGSESNDFSIETLLSYEPTPGTVFFIGYSRQMEDIGAFRFRNVQAQADGLFLKLSYRFRM